MIPHRILFEVFVGLAGGGGGEGGYIPRGRGGYRGGRGRGRGGPGGVGVEQNGESQA